MNFLKAEILYIAVFAISFILFMVIRGSVMRKRALSMLLGAKSKASQFSLLSPWRRAVRLFLFFVIILLLVIAAARPYWEEVERTISNTGRDVLIIFDVSKSMLATDRPPSRFQHAQMLARELIDGLPGDRFALIPFAGTAILNCPFTPDINSVNMYINELSTESIPQGGTNLARALEVGERAFKSADGDNNVIVLLTDGEELSGDIAQAVEQLQKKRIPLLIFGIGDSISGAPIPVKDDNGNPQFVRDESGNVVYSKLNSALLSRIANETGGRFFDSSAGNPQTNSAIDFIKRFNKRTNEDGKRMLPLEKFGAFIALGAILLAIMLLISEYRKSTILVAILLCSIVVKSETINPELSTSIVLEIPAGTTPEIIYNQARALQSRSDNSGALKLYETLLKEVQTPEITAKTLHNLAVMNHQKLQQDITSIQSALQNQKLDEAKTAVAKSESELASTKQGYIDSLKVGIQHGDMSSDNVKRLLKDANKLEELKKAIEELQKQQQQSQQSLNQAKQDNQQSQQQENQQQSSEQSNNSQESNPSSAPSESKDQPSQSSSKSNESNTPASQSTQKSQQDLKDLQQKAENLGQKDLAERARKAQEHVQKAQQSQDKSDYKEAQKFLEQAQEELGNSPEQGEPQSSKPESDQGKSNNNAGAEPATDQAKPEPSEQNAEAQSDTGSNGTPKESPSPERQSKEKLLEVMSDDEQQTRQDLNRLQNQLRRPYKVIKDY